MSVIGKQTVAAPRSNGGSGKQQIFPNLNNKHHNLIICFCDDKHAQYSSYTTVNSPQLQSMVFNSMEAKVLTFKSVALPCPILF